MRILRGKNIETKSMFQLQKEIDMLMQNMHENNDGWADIFEIINEDGSIDSYKALLVWWEEELEEIL